MEFDRKKIIEICSKSMIFKDINKDIIERLISLLTYEIMIIPKDELIIRENEVIDYMGVILNGNANVCKYSSDGREILISKLKISDILGLDIFFTTTKKSFYNVYTTETCYVLKIDQKTIQKNRALCRYIFSCIYLNIITCISNEEVKMADKIEVMSQKGLRNKIIAYLSIQKKNKKSNIFQIDFDREQLSNYLGINRSVLSHELSLMQEDGLIKFKKNKFEILY